MTEYTRRDIGKAAAVLSTGALAGCSSDEDPSGTGSGSWEKHAEYTSNGSTHPDAKEEVNGQEYELVLGRTENQYGEGEESELDCQSAIAVELTGNGETVEGVLEEESDWRESLQIGDVRGIVERTSCDLDSNNLPEPKYNFRFETR